MVEPDGIEPVGPWPTVVGGRFDFPVNQPLTIANEWWSRTGSNRRPEACKATALPTELRPHSTQNNGGPG